MAVPFGKPRRVTLSAMFSSVRLRGRLLCHASTCPPTWVAPMARRNDHCPMRHLIAIAVFLCASLVVAADPQSAAPAPRAITLDDFGRVKSPGEPHFSPDGRSIA